jgi:hypothetical protein
MQVVGACNPKGGGGSKCTYGTYATTMEQDYGKNTKDCSRNGKMCKDKWNVLNFDYKKLVDCHKGTRHHASFWDLTMEEWERY